MGEREPWFEPLGDCDETPCIRAAVGVLYASDGERVGVYCRQHAKSKIGRALAAPKPTRTESSAPRVGGRVFSLLVDAAIAGRRCPTADELENAAGTYGRIAPILLAEEGKIRIEVFAHNWRVVTICEGPHAGAKTAPPPGQREHQPYHVIEPGGRRRRPKRERDRA